LAEESVTVKNQIRN